MEINLTDQSVDRGMKISLSTLKIIKSREQSVEKVHRVLMKFFTNIGLSIEIKLIKFFQKSQRLARNEFNYVKCCLLSKLTSEWPCTMQVQMVLRLLAHSLTTFGHETAAGVAFLRGKDYRWKQRTEKRPRRRRFTIGFAPLLEFT